jgi:hypothetical protein
MKKIIEIPKEAFEQMYLNGKNVEVESGEHVKNSEDGSIKEVVGKKHIDGGEKINLPDQSKVLSDYTKIGAKNIETFTKMYDIKLKASDTFATVLDKYNKKIGIKEIEEEEKDLLEKFEKNEKSSIDETTKKINENFLTQEISHLNNKKVALNKLKDKAFEEIFIEQEKIPKKGDGSQILDKGGKPIDKKQDIYQEGGQQLQNQIDPQQIAQALQQGVTPDQIIEQLIQSGVGHEEAMTMVQQIAQQLQQEQPGMQEGGINDMPNYSFATQYTPTIPGFDVKGNSILNQPTLSDVEYMQRYIPGKGYGQKMQDVEKTINTHNWYFDTEEKKKAFREAVLSDKATAQKPVGDFQKAYNEELTQRAKKAGVDSSEISNLINTVGFSGKGVQKLDSKFGAFTSSRPLFDFNRVPLEAPTEPGVDPQKVRRDLVKGVIYDEGMPYVMPPSAPLAPYLQQVSLNRLEGQKGSVENQLQASENARQAAYESARGLPPAQAAAVMANYLATSGQQDTQGIAAQEMQDLQNKTRIEQYNAGQGDKESLLNEQLKKQYEKEAFATLNVNEQNWRNYYDANEANRKAISDEIKRRNILNMSLSNYQLNGSGGFDFVNQSPFQRQAVMSPAQLAFYNSLTPEKKLEYEKVYASKSGQV